jgi:predicted dinucleotide-binding enzyme
MKIGVVGSGHVGGTVGSRWAKNGHAVIFSSRNPQSEAMRALVKQSSGSARAATVQETAQSSEILLLATPWQGTEDAIREMGDLAGKIVIDATNPLLEDLSGLEIGTTTSAGEQVAAWAKGAKVVKALNTVGYNVMENPAFGSDRPAMFYCGDDKDAKLTVKGLIDELGFEALDAGPMTQARLLEPFALLWISLAIGQGYGFEIAFKLLRR